MSFEILARASFLIVGIGNGVSGIIIFRRIQRLLAQGSSAGVVVPNVILFLMSFVSVVVITILILVLFK